jgi:alpha-D-xyloside xylohydrolase
VITGVLHLRERLRPYLHEQLRAAAAVGLPPMRPLFVDHPGDERAWTVEDQFQLGPDLLVAPVAEPGATAREVYLPVRADGRRWVDAVTGDAVHGGRTVTAAAPIERIPVFVAEGAPVLAAVRDPR